MYKFIISVFSLLLMCLIHASAQTNKNCIHKFHYEVKAVSCYGGDDGAIDIFVDSINNPSFQWSNSQSTEDIYNLNSGTYNLKIVDNNCETDTTIFVPQPKKPLSVKLAEKKDITCEGYNDGMIRIEAEGGNAPYLYTINNINTFSSENLFENLMDGDYTITVKDYNNCQDIVYVTIEPASSVEINIGDKLKIYSGEEVEIAAPEGYMEYLWSTSETAQMIVFRRETDKEIKEILTVDAIDENGCSTTSNNLEIKILPKIDRKITEE